MKKDDKQLSLFDRPEAIKQKVRELPESTRKVLHKELYRLLENRTYGSESDLEYDQNKRLAWDINKLHANRLLELYDPQTLLSAIIFFLAEIDGYKRIYNKEKGGMRTYTKDHLLEAERGKPLLVLSEMINVCAEQANLQNEELSLVGELLLRNTGYKSGVLETFYLGLLGLIGTKSERAYITQYRKSVVKGQFGYPAHIAVGTTAYAVQGKVLEKIKNDRLKKIQEVRKKISSR